MDALEWATWVLAGATLLAALILGISAFLARDALGDARRTRHGQLIVDIDRRWAEPAMVESLRLHGTHGNKGITKLVEELFGGTTTPSKDDLDEFFKLKRIPDLIEMIGVLQSEEVLSARIIHKLWGPTIVSIWTAWRDAVTELRKHDEQDAEESYLYFKNVAAEMLRIDKEAAKARRASKPNPPKPQRSQPSGARP
jgi:hypothetical protein